VSVDGILPADWAKVLEVFEPPDWDDFSRSFGLKIKKVPEHEIGDWLADREKAARDYLSVRLGGVTKMFGPIAGPLGNVTSTMVEEGQEIIDSIFGPVFG
jgi:hypothetical protein